MRSSRILAILALIVFLAPAAVVSAAPVKVHVLPFSVYSDEDLSHLSGDIAKRIGDFLSGEGAKVTVAPAAPDKDPASLGMVELRRVGRAADADWLVYGSFSKFGERYSLDAKVLSVTKPEPVTSLFVEGEGIGTLVSKVEDISIDIAAKVLGRSRVTDVRVEGNKGIESDAILKVIKTKKGDVFSPTVLSEDMDAVFAMGYFDDVRVEAEESPRGMDVIIHVVVKPRVNKVQIEGNRKLDDEDIREVLDISRGSILNRFRIEENIRRIKALYESKNYYNAEISYQIEPVSDNEADLTFDIKEGDKVLIKEIRFVGNEAFSDSELRGVMKTKEKGFFSFITSSGTLNPEDLNRDIVRLSAFYHNHGYVRAKVSEPEEKIEGKWIYITIRVEEGKQYKVGPVDITGDLIEDKEKLLKKLKIQKEDYYNQDVIRQDILVLSDVYSDAGYAYADVYPTTNINEEDLTVGIDYVIEKGVQVYFEEIIITGNTKTRDYVIRRELPIYEQGLYSGGKLKQGLRNLARLDYFEDLQVDTVRGSAEDKMNVKLRVAEKPTGSFTFGGGYSSLDNLFFMSTVEQRNLMGRGQTLALKASIGSATTLYDISFTEPYLFGSRLSFGVSLYRLLQDYDTYEKLSNGGSVRFGYPLWDYTRLFLSYNYDVADIRDITWGAADIVWEMEGKNVESSVSTSIVRDTRNHVFNPTRGSRYVGTVEYAGGLFGGDVAFTKYVGEAGWYFPIFWELTGFLHAKAGYVAERPGDGILPIYDRFFLGGINTLRGYTWEEASPMDADGALIGGNKFILGNAELHLPIIKKAGLIGVVFYDTGNEWDDDQNIKFGYDDLLKTAGVGIRWYSPMGPIRLERGWIIDAPPTVDSDGRWEFAMGTAF